MQNRIIKTAIVDDEPSARDGLQLMLSDDKDLEIAGICRNGIEAIQLLQEGKVDLVFLDIHMPGINGFEVLDNIGKDRWPYVVFVTAYDEYAIRAFEYHAFDYLLKPFSDERFSNMLQRVKKAIYSNRKLEQSEKFDHLKNELTESLSSNKELLYEDQVSGEQSLIIKDSGKIIIIPVRKISCIEAYDYYVKIHYEDQFKLTRIPLKRIVHQLPENFQRVHRSYVINIHHIEHLDKRGKGETVVLLRNGIKVRVSSSHKKDLLNRLKSE